MKVLTLAAQGYPNAKIANRLGVNIGIVKLGLSEAMRILGASDRTHAVAIAMQEGFIQLAK